MIRRPFLLLAVVLLTGCADRGAEPSPDPDRERGRARPSVLLITIDTWRWDHIGVSGAGRVATPNLDALARGGVYEPEMMTPCPLTTPAHASLMTGRDLWSHGVADCTGYRLKENLPTLAERFASAGYLTGAWISSETLHPRFGLDRGFSIYEHGALTAREDAEGLHASRDGTETTDLFLRFLEEAPEERPIFAWVHYFDLHTPYRPRAEYDVRYPGQPYAAQAAFVDAQVGALTAALRRDAGRAWRVVVVGDHGEGLGDHGERGHGYLLYRSTLHVPFIVSPAPQDPLRHARPWSLIDVAPTLARWCGLEAWPEGEGEDLFTEGGQERTLAAGSLLPSLLYSVRPALGVRRGDLVLLDHGEAEVYDLRSDPEQGRDRSTDTALAEARGALDRAFRAACDPLLWRPLLAPTLTLSEREAAALRSLGYLSGGRPDGARLQRADLRALVRDHEALQQARLEEAPAALRARFDSLIARYPGAATLRKNLGVTLARLGDWASARGAFEDARRLNPRDAGTLVDLGAACIKVGDAAGAEQALLGALAVDDTIAEAHKNLGILYAELLGRPSEAAARFRRYLELAPGARDADAVRDAIGRLERNAP